MDYEVVDSEEHYRSKLTTVRVDHVRMPDGDVATREVVSHLSAVAVVALDDDDQIVLLRHFRHPFGRHHLELPAGKLDVEGEDVTDALRRELAEEAQLSAERLEHLVTFANSAGWTDEETHVYLATGLLPAPQPEGFQPTHEEADMEVLRMSLDEALELAMGGEIPDAKTLIGILAVAARRQPTIRTEQP